MLENFIKALQDAIFATGKSMIEVAGACKVSTITLYRLTGTSNPSKPIKRNANAFVNYLDTELDNIIRHHNKEILRLREIKVAMKNEYNALYGERKGGRSE